MPPTLHALSDGKVAETRKFEIHCAATATATACERIVLGKISEDGTVEGVSYGTPIGWNPDFYNEIVCCPITYGQAMTILLLQEIRLL